MTTVSRAPSNSPPLTSIGGFAEMLGGGYAGELPPVASEYVTAILDSVARLGALIDNVLDLSRIEGGRRVYERAPATVEPIVREALEPFAYPLRQGGFKVEVDVAPDLPDVPMDADAVGQALANLVDNAMKYSAERRAIRIGAAVREGQVAIAVAELARLSRPRRGAVT